MSNGLPVTIAHGRKENAIGDGKDVGRGFVALNEGRREGLAGGHLNPLGDRSRVGKNGSRQGTQEIYMMSV